MANFSGEGRCSYLGIIITENSLCTTLETIVWYRTQTSLPRINLRVGLLRCFTGWKNTTWVVGVMQSIYRLRLVVCVAQGVLRGQTAVLSLDAIAANGCPI